MIELTTITRSIHKESVAQVAESFIHSYENYAEEEGLAIAKELFTEVQKDKRIGKEKLGHLLFGLKKAYNYFK